MGNGSHDEPLFRGVDMPAIAHIRWACLTCAYVEDTKARESKIGELEINGKNGRKR